MANVSASDAIRAALSRGGAFEDAAAMSRRWMFRVGELTDGVHALRQAAGVIDSDELTGPLSAAYRELQQAYLVIFLAWRRLDR